MLDDTGRILAGIMLLTIVTIEFGGYFMTKIVRGQVPMTDFQKSFARAGHAHAGVLVILGLVVQLLMPSTTLTGPAAWVARLGVPLAAILMSGGFFAASAGKDRTRPNKAIAILGLGALSLAAGVVTLGVGLLVA
ncbi:hypothetical protein [Phytomonospora endophytica]|uniref:Integral membrane protein n=1 Tax=Phytomonospora endophytica TaxID=714109 RepID=A0A841FK31_9ACTN|nr:hypothetical protein [Phytomonospora endophytica]MBB6034188.1 hypothetical protein [Phytomonospora endophytica]GIG66580.1 hypothetical protein Pen01_28750 [Phytomonospora endophytica]